MPREVIEYRAVGADIQGDEITVTFSRHELTAVYMALKSQDAHDGFSGRVWESMLDRIWAALERSEDGGA